MSAAMRLPAEATDEVAALIEKLHEASRRLEELTEGEVDTVASRDGRTYLLRHAQDHSRHNEAAKQAAVLNALPAYIALLNRQGTIVSVNEAWRGYAGPDVVQRPGYDIGLKLPRHLRQRFGREFVRGSPDRPRHSFGAGRQVGVFFSRVLPAFVHRKGLVSPDRDSLGG